MRSELRAIEPEVNKEKGLPIAGNPFFIFD
jgi:hypothetical protein